MNQIAQFLIDLLTDFQTLGTAGQFTFVLALVGAVAGFVSWRKSIAKAKQTQFVAIAAQAEIDLKAAKTTVAEQTSRIRELEEYDAETVAKSLAHDRENNNRAPMIATADGYMEHHRASFAAACEVLAEHHLTRFEDGEDALTRARSAALGVVAANPGKDANAMVEEIDALIRVESAPTENQEQEKAREERARLRKLLDETHGDYAALMAVGEAEVWAGRYRTALAFFRRAEDVAPPRSPACIDASRWVGTMLNFSGRAAEAEPMLRALAQTAATVIGGEEPSTLTIIHEHASALMNLGQVTQAEAALRDLIPLMEKVNGPEHPGTLATRHEHARALLNLGQAAKAEAALRDLILLLEKVNGPEHSHTLTARHEHARALLNLGQAAKAEAALRDLIPLREKVNGPEHPDTLTTRHAHATALLNFGQVAQAEAALRDLVPLREKVQGPEHPNTLATRHEHARALMGLGQAAPAELALRDLISLMEKVNGPEHSDTLSTRYAHASALLDLGQVTQAEPAFRDLVPLGKKVQGPEHPNTLLTRQEHARALLNLGRVAQAEAAFRDLIPLMGKVNGPEHPYSLIARRQWARASLELGDANHARRILSKVPKDSHPDPVAKWRDAFLSAWLADLDGDASKATEFLDQGEAHLSDLEPEHYAHRELQKYRETRVPGGKGGTSLWAKDLPENQP